MLIIDHEERPGIEVILEHPFFDEYREEIDEDSKNYPKEPFHVLQFPEKRSLGIDIVDKILDEFSVRERKFNPIRFQCVDLIDRILLEDKEFRKKHKQEPLSDALVKLYSFVAFI